MPKFLVEYKARTPNGKMMVPRRTIVAPNPRAAIKAFNKQVPNEGIVRVWQEALVTQTSKRLAPPSE